MIDPIDRNTALDITEGCAKSLKWILSDEDLSESERKECEWKLDFVESIISDLKNVPSIAQRQEPCKDAVNRQAAIDALLHNQEIYSNKFNDDPACLYRYTIAIIDNDVQAIANLPSAQPELIRCKDCKYYKKYNGYTVCTISPLHKVIRKPDDYCSRAGRRQE